MSWDAARKKRHPPMTDAQYQERLKSRCAIDANGCWLYTGFLYWNGYGDMCYRNKNWRIHRLAFHLFKGPIPKWHDVCHTCDVRHCCNPDHLWTGPRQLNNRDTRDKKRDNNSQKTHCPRGHSYAEHGVFREDLGYKGWRSCKACQRGHQRVKKGWPADLAYTLPPQRLGFVANPNHPKCGKSPVSSS